MDKDTGTGMDTDMDTDTHLICATASSLMVGFFSYACSIWVARRMKSTISMIMMPMAPIRPKISCWRWGKGVWSNVGQCGAMWECGSGRVGEVIGEARGERW